MRPYRVSLLAAALLAALVPTPATAQLSGTWSITASFSVGQLELFCTYSGSGMLTQMGDQVSGPISLTLDMDQPQDCPGEMVGELSATVTGSTFDGSVDGTNDPMGDRGVANVSGTIVEPPAAATKAAMTMMSGNAAINSGPFASGIGNFNGQLMAAPASAIGNAALALLALVLLGGSTLLLVRRPVQP